MVFQAWNRELAARIFLLFLKFCPRTQENTKRLACSLGGKSVGQNN